MTKTYSNQLTYFIFKYYCIQQFKQSGSYFVFSTKHIGIFGMRMKRHMDEIEETLVKQVKTSVFISYLYIFSISYRLCK